MDKTTAGILAGAAAAVVLGAVLLLGEEASADRTDVWSANSVKVSITTLTRQADGGCAAQAQARYTLTDGGSPRIEDSAEKQLSGANRTTCLGILDTDAPLLFKQDKGL